MLAEKALQLLQWWLRLPRRRLTWHINGESGLGHDVMVGDRWASRDEHWLVVLCDSDGATVEDVVGRGLESSVRLQLRRVPRRHSPIHI